MGKTLVRETPVFFFKKTEFLNFTLYYFVSQIGTNYQVS